jgi:4-amino-4-deoxy-L-arabinose transferase-like glycosyltransferase
VTEPIVRVGGLTKVFRSYRRAEGLAAARAAPAGSRAVLLLAALTALALLPFAGKAFHIDDTLFLKAARQIQAHPLDFYGFSVNWYGTEQPMWQVMKNPPLASYFIALVTAIAGEKEIALHVAFLVPAIAAILGTYVLARRLSPHPLLAALATLFCPAFLVSSTNVMCDTLLLAFWVWAVELWLRGIDGGRPGTLAASALLVSLAALTKYFGVALVPLFVVYAVASRRRLEVWGPFLLIPLAILAAYQWATLSLYGVGLLGDAGLYASRLKTHGEMMWWKVFVALVFSGGSLFTGALLLPLFERRRTLVAAFVLSVAGFLLLTSADSIGGFFPKTGTPGRGLLISELVVFALGGLGLLGLAAADVQRNRDRDSLLLFLWVVGTFLFGPLVNWTVSVRNLLPIAPAAAILAVRRLDRDPSIGRGFRWLAPLTIGAGLSLLVAAGDAHLADSARNAAERIARDFGRHSTPLWFQGHWGFQYYMEKTGALPFDRLRRAVRAGDRMAVPTNNTWVVPVSESAVTLVSRIDVPILPPVATVQPIVGAGFYSDSWGPLPFAIGRVPPERYFLFEILRPDELVHR